MLFLSSRTGHYCLRATASIFFILIALLCNGPAYAADGDTLRADLDAVYIEASRLAVPWIRQPVQVSLVDSAAAGATSAKSLGDLLRYNSAMNVRTYGLGGIQSVSSRGFGARQTQLVWNGFIVNHTMLGEVDYTLIPAVMTENLRVVSGMSSAGFGEGGTAGAVLFDSPGPQNRTSFGIQTGKWGQQQLSLQSGFRTEQYRAGLMLSGAQATNNYPYFDDIRNRTERRRKNQFQNRHAMLTAGTTRGDFSGDVTVWAGFAEHHVAGSSTVRNPQAVQDDEFLRISALAGYRMNNGLWQLGLFSERYRLDYVDPPSRINSESTQQRYRGRLSYSFAPAESLFLTAGAEAGLARVETNNYSESKERRDFSLFTRGEITPFEQLSIFPLARYIYYSDTGSRFTGSLGFNLRTPLSWLHLRGQAALNFSPPTLNDLYWSPGGNPDLRPEESITFEGGISATPEFRSVRMRFGVTAWNTNFENGIRWLPGLGGVWSPKNLAEIRSRGVEAETTFRYRSGRFSLHSTGALIYTKAESPQTRSSQGETTTVWKQLTYVPEWSWKAVTGIGFDPVYLNAAWQHSGSRFTTSDHSSPRDPLASVSDLTIQAGIQFSFRGMNASAGYSLHNALDREQEFISRYPMPPRYHTLSLNFSFDHKR